MALGAAALVALGLAAPSAVAQVAAPTSDVAPAPQPAVAPEPETDPLTAWLFGPAGRAEVEALSTQIGSSASVVGFDIDHETKTLTVVVDDDHPGASAVREAVAGHIGDLHIEVRSSARAVGVLNDALHHVEQRPDDAQLHSEPSATYIDPATDTVVVITPTDGAVADAMRAEYGDAVTIVDGRPHRFAGSRTADVPSHWAGAQIWNEQTGDPCTSGFTTYNVFGVRGSTTAAHCGAATNVWRTAWSTDPKYYLGEGWGNANFPTQDFQWIRGAGVSYTNVVHTDPCCPISRSVTGKADPVLASTICASGAVTRATCAPVVQSTNASLCDFWGCTPNLAYAVASPWSPVSTFGDSGGPTYTRPTSSTATARGLILGGTFGNDVFIQKVSTIEGAGLTILTSP